MQILQIEIIDPWLLAFRANGIRGLRSLNNRAEEPKNIFSHHFDKRRGCRNISVGQPL